MTTHKARQAAADAANAPGLTTTLIILAVIISGAVLCYTGKIGGDAFVGAVAGPIIGGVLVRAGVASGSAASTAPPPAED